MNMKRLLTLCSFVFLSLFTVAQNTNVTAIVQDPGGQLFKNGNWIASFRRNPNSGSIQPRYAASQVLINEGPFQGSIDGSGALSVTLADTLLVAPAGGQWTFVLCPNVTTGCTTVNVVVTGGSQNISSIVNAQIPPIKISPGGPLGRAYQDSEIQGGPGNSWLDVTLNVLKYIDTNGVIQTVGSGGGGGGCGAGSCIVNNPGGGVSQTVVQANGTDFATNVLNKRMRADLFTWTILPSVPLSISAGTNIVTLPTCPLGIQGTNLNHKLLLGTTGTPEIVVITGGTCTSGATNGTIQFDSINSHGAGYSIGTATGGLKEASEYAKSAPTNPLGNLQSGYVTVTPGVSLNIQATAYITSANQTIDFSGSYIECSVLNNLPCIKTGNDISAGTATDITLINLRVRAMVPNTGPALEVNSNGTTVRNFTVRQALAGGNYFGSLIQVDNDQAFNLDGFDPSLGSWAKCDSTLCSTALISNGPFGTNAGLAWVSHANISGNCLFNGVLWKNNNTLHISDSVIQSYAQYGIIYDTHLGGFGTLSITNTYEESDGCTNPDYTAAGATGTAAAVQVGLLTQANTTITGGEGPSGFVPTFICSGSSGSLEFNYFILIKDSIKGNSAPLLAGKTPTTCSGTVTIYWPKVPGTATVTYDIIRTSSVGAGNSIINPVTSNCTGGSTANCGSRALSVVQCGGKVCSFADDTTLNTTSYTIPPPLNKPYLPYWPGNVVISMGSDISGGIVAFAFLMIDDAGKLGNSNGIGTISVWGNSQPSIYALRCSLGSIGYPGVMSCINGDSGQYAATLLGMGVTNGGPSGEQNTKGRLNFWRSPNSSTLNTEIITLSDATPDLTAATPNYRPAANPLDTYIGIDSGSVNAQAVTLATGSPIAISQYIASLPDGSSFKERLTATLKLFTVPVQVNSGGLTSAVLMSDSSVNCGNTNTNTSQLCSGTDSGNTFQPIWTQNISGTQVQSALLLKINNDIVGGYAGIGSNGLIPISDLVSDPSACAPGTVIAGNQANCINGGGSTGFASLLAGTSTGQAFLIGNGSSMAVTGTGTLNASLLNGVTYPSNIIGGINLPDKALISTAAGVVGATSVPNCSTSINYSTSTHAFTCAGTSALIPMVLLQCNGTANACPSTAVTGTGASLALMTFTLPGGTLPSNRCFHARVFFQHTSGTAVASFSWTFGATSTSSSTTSGNTSNLQQADLDVCNYNNSTAIQYIRAGQYILGNVNLAGATVAGTESTVSNQNLSFNFSVANTDTFSFNGGYITFP